MADKKYEMNLPIEFLEKIAEFDRSDPKQQIDTWGYTSENTINKIAEDCKNGKGIEKRVEVIVHDGKALLVQGCHRVAGAKQGGLKKVPTLVVFLETIGKFFSAKDKMKKI